MKHYPTIGAFIQCFKQPVSTIETIRTFRSVYPDASLFVVSDGGYHYDGLAKRFGAQYKHLDRIGKDIGIVSSNRDVMVSWLTRLIDAARQMTEDYVIILEDDVRIIKPVSRLGFDLNGINPELGIGKKMTSELKRRGAQIAKGCEDFYYGGCGGSVISREFLVGRIGSLDLHQAVRDLEPFLDDHLKNHYVSDYWLSVLTLLQGGTMGDYEGFAETWHIGYIIRKQVTHTIETLHFDKSLHNTPLSLEDVEILGGSFTTGELTDYQLRSNTQSTPKSIPKKILEVFLSPKKWVMWSKRKYVAYKRLQSCK